MRKLLIGSVILSLLSVFVLSAVPSSTAAQPIPVTPQIPFANLDEPSLVILPTEDARLATCAAPTLIGFMPYTLQGSENLTHLLIGSEATSTQIASLNCLDSTTHLPAGITIWLPSDAWIIQASASQVRASETAPVSPVIETFTVSAEDITENQPVTVSWRTEGERAFFTLCEDCLTRVEVPMNGAIEFASFQASQTLTARLIIEGNGETAEAEVTWTVTCAQSWIGDADVGGLCPEQPPLAVPAVYQAFEHGLMIWFSDTSHIYVLFDDGTFLVYEDAFVEGMPDPTDQAPEGLLTPVRGFGLLWSHLDENDTNPLGWATAGEIGFDSARQGAGRTSYTTYIQGPETSAYALTEIPGMPVGYWSLVRGL